MAGIMISATQPPDARNGSRTHKNKPNNLREKSPFSPAMNPVQGV